jgi:hypothetical protein
MGGSFVKGCAVGAVCMLVGGVSTLALAGSGVGGVFNLGVSNSVDARSTLTGASPVAQLQVTNTNASAGAFGLGVTSGSATPTESVTNTSTGTGLSVLASSGGAVSAQSGGASTPTLVAKNTAGGPAASFAVTAGAAPFKVSSQTKVSGLNADLIDGLDSTALKGPAGSPGPPGPPGPNPALTIDASIGTGDSDTILTLPGNWLSINAFCPTPGDTTNYGFVTGALPVTMFSDGGTPDPNLLSLLANSSNGSSFWQFNPDGDFYTFSASDGTHTATIFIFNRKHTNPFTHLTFCDFQGHVVSTP